MASLFTAEYYDVDYKVVLEGGKTIRIKFSDDNCIDDDEYCSESDCHECYDRDSDDRYVLYARDIYDDIKRKTFTSIYLSSDECCDYVVSQIYLNDALIYSDSILIQ